MHAMALEYLAEDAAAKTMGRFGWLGGKSRACACRCMVKPLPAPGKTSASQDMKWVERSSIQQRHLGSLCTRGFLRNAQVSADRADGHHRFTRSSGLRHSRHRTRLFSVIKRKTLAGGGEMILVNHAVVRPALEESGLRGRQAIETKSWYS